MTISVSIPDAASSSFLAVTKKAPRPQVNSFNPHLAPESLTSIDLCPGASPVFLNRAFITSSATIPLVLAASIAYQSGRRKTLLTALGAVLVAATAISLFGFLRHFSEGGRARERLEASS
ncbi:MAG TPA: hypothetical protein VOA64_07725 [Candidatus Dormibacteraeota bacterium]|nr:hypothetical protein [Candidatus Dormibacteraeota bacterium]